MKCTKEKKVMFQRRIYASVLKHTFQSMCEIDITDKISRKRKF